MVFINKSAPARQENSFDPGVGSAHLWNFNEILHIFNLHAINTSAPDFPLFKNRQIEVIFASHTPVDLQCKIYTLGFFGGVRGCGL